MIKEICIEPGCPFKGGYCRVPGHKKQRTGDAPPKPVAPRKAIPKESPQRKQDNKKLRKVVAEKKKEHGAECMLKIKDVCIGGPVHSSHIEDRAGDNLTDPDKIELACDPCNRWCQEHPRLAEALGHKVSRSTKPSKKRKHLYAESAE